MRIVELNPFYTPYRGGIERRIEAITSRLSSRHECFVVTSRLPGTQEEEKIAGATVIRLKSRFFGRYNPPFVMTKGVADMLRSIEPDVVDYHYRWAGSYNRAFRSWPGGRVVTFHNQYGEGEGLLHLLSVLNDRAYIGRLRGVHFIAISGFVRNQLMEHGVQRELAHLAYNGIEEDTCTASDEGFALFIGRLVPSKGLRYLAEASERSALPVQVAGEGPMKHFLSKYRNMRLLGHVDEGTKHSLLSRCSFLVLPSLQESFGIAALEAMAHGKPVVASSAGGLPEVVGDAGILVPPGSSAPLARAMNSLAGDSELRHSLGERARERASKFSWTASVRSIEEVYALVAA